ncbi:MAG: class I SAM-dependent methyltransferase [Actinomycetota bacterium]
MPNYIPGWVWVTKEIEPYLKGRGVDIGCNMWPYPGAIPLDPAEIVITRLKKEPYKMEHAILASGDKLDMFKDMELDYVFSSHSLEHIIDYKKALEEWDRVLKIGGYLVIYMPHPSHQGWNADNYKQHHHNLTFDMVYNEVKNNIDLVYGTNQKDSHSGFLFIGRRK